MKRIDLILFVLFVVFVGFILDYQFDRAKECKAKGGVLVRDISGYICVKAQKL